MTTTLRTRIEKLRDTYKALAKLGTSFERNYLESVIADLDAALAADQSEPEPVKAGELPPCPKSKCPYCQVELPLAADCYESCPKCHGYFSFHKPQHLSPPAAPEPEKPYIGDGVLHPTPPPADGTQAKYLRSIIGCTADGGRDCLSVDVYDVLRAFNVTDPALQHAIKKCLLAGERGHKDRATDLREALESIRRAN